MFRINLPLIMMLAAVSIVVSCGSPSVAENRAGAKELLKTDRNFSEFSVRHGSADAFRKYLAPDALLLPAGANPIRGRDSIYASMEGDTVGVLSWTPREAEVAQSGEMGYTWGEYMYEYPKQDGTAGRSHGKYLNVWKKQSDGTWRVFIDIGNQSPVPTGGADK
ncbi:MAG: nuclear transport factor 2 family protein [Candidatus Marinimicrobia bacterium]|nr:nuclear transport factor 2 family protein [Candidatus Neomarinimicrobiota bacterium]MCF7830275.1 nuclear transport factor 2 family protein [Candidatus Neomarinimicrobiota bacterium]MCF7882184.1 nuclear transport factor 2 family protein [Candidatus Neomarinimicrobiota bacterium]